METTRRNIEKYRNSFLYAISFTKTKIKSEITGTVKKTMGITKPAYSDDGTIKLVYSI
ncbi:hypothetical protein [Flavobacterium sp. RS13.1]|uniref:hypothetical protein n=1 Tax=Flavobacterium sp. RS13.1 TaxID=3400345 RepID=UPI003AAD4BAD